jgi:hypothetical protein
MLSVDCHLPEIVPLQAIGDDGRRISHLRNEAVLSCRFQVIDAICPTATIQSICVGKKWLGSQSSDLLYDGPDKNRVHIRVVSLLSEVDLYGGKVAFLCYLIEKRSIKEAHDHILLVVSNASRPNPGKIDCALHSPLQIDDGLCRVIKEIDAHKIQCLEKGYMLSKTLSYVDSSRRGFADDRQEL